MIAAILAVFSLLQLSPAQRARVSWVPNPRAANSTWVSDASHHLLPATRDTLNAIIGALEHESSAEIAVAVVDSTSGLEAQEFATALHRAWGVGKSGKDNGVLLLWDPVGRAVFISVGYGLEGAIPDRRAGRIRDEIVGEFRQSHFDAGIIAGVRSLAAAAREEGPQQRQGITRSLEGGGESSGGGRGGVLAWVGGILGGLAAAIGGIFGFVRWRRYRPRECSNGHPMRRLTEQQENGQLDQGSQSEERVGSVDWDVWVCKTCQEVTRIPYRQWASPYQDCPKCKRRTMSESTKTIEAATTSSGGTETVIDHCGNCGYRSEGTRSTPRIVERSRSGGASFSGGSSGGGGSGGGSFGGGSAGGGGAGGKY